MSEIPSGEGSSGAGFSSNESTFDGINHNDASAFPEIEYPNTWDPTTLAAEMGANIDDPVRMYLREIGKIPLLSRAKELELAEKIAKGEGKTADLLMGMQDAKADLKSLQGERRQLAPARQPSEYNQLTSYIEDKKREIEQINSRINATEAGYAFQQMVNANLRLVVSVAKKYIGRGMSLLDLIQEGNIGLIRAVEKFDHTKGFHLSTYATWWIRQAITRAIADQARTIRVPVHMVETIERMFRISRGLVQELGRDPTFKETGLAMGMDPETAEEEVSQIVKYSQMPISLETPVGEEEDSHLGDFIEDTTALAPADAATHQILKEQVKDALGTLSIREQEVLRLRFGLDDGRSRTLEEVGREFRVTRERIRQIEAKALRKLKHPYRSGKLKDYWDDNNL